MAAQKFANFDTFFKIHHDMTQYNVTKLFQMKQFKDN